MADLNAAESGERSRPHWTLYDDLDAVSALRFELFVPGPNDDVAASVELGEFLTCGAGLDGDGGDP